MDGRPTWTDCDEAGDYVVPNVLSPRDLVYRPDNMDETVPHTYRLASVRTILTLLGLPDNTAGICELSMWSLVFS